jgi:hypothetical protein
MRGLATVRPPRASQHDPEKWTPVFEKDHAQTINQNEIVKRHFVLAFVTRPTRPPIKALIVAAPLPATIFFAVTAGIPLLRWVDWRFLWIVLDGDRSSSAIGH